MLEVRRSSDYRIPARFSGSRGSLSFLPVALILEVPGILAGVFWIRYAINKLRAKIGALRHRVNDEHPDSLRCRVGLAVFLVGLKTCCGSNRALTLEEQCKDTEGLPQKISKNKHDPQTILSWLDISVSSSPPKPLADELLTEMRQFGRIATRSCETTSVQEASAAIDTCPMQPVLRARHG